MKGLTLSLISHYRETAEIRRLTASIEEARGRLDRYLANPEEWHGVIRRQVMASVVHYSTMIEGNRLTRDQVEAIIAGDSIEAPHKDRVEAQNYYQAMEWSRTCAQDPSWKLTHESILTLHFLIGQKLGADYEPLGRYREGQNWVVDRKSGVTIYRPPPHERVRGLMDELVLTVRRLGASGVHPYVLNALVHLNFAAIHPFSDGNGRVDRVLCSLLIMREGYRSQAFFSLEEYFGKNWEEYGLQFRRTLGDEWPTEPARLDNTAWIEWYLGAVSAEAQGAADAFERELNSFTVVGAGMLAHGAELDRKVVAVWLAVREGRVTNRKYRTIVNIESRTATKDFGELVDEGYLARTGERRASEYVPGPVVKSWGDMGELLKLLKTDSGAPLTAHFVGVEQAAQPTLPGFDPAD